jgi:hypothetical protein
MINPGLFHFSLAKRSSSLLMLKTTKLNKAIIKSARSFYVRDNRETGESPVQPPLLYA